LGMEFNHGNASKSSIKNIKRWLFNYILKI
jgi:hypothetical protein